MIINQIINHVKKGPLSSPICECVNHSESSDIGKYYEVVMNASNSYAIYSGYFSTLNETQLKNLVYNTLKA